MAKKNLSSEKAAAEISNMIAEGTAKDAADAVSQRPELQPGLKYFEESKPISKGSGAALLERF